MQLTVTSWNRIMTGLSGISETEAIGQSLPGLVEASFSPYTYDEVTETVSREGVWRGEVTIRNANGDTVYLLHTVSLQFDENGREIGLLHVGRDITERKRAESRLLESELFYRNLISHSLDGIVMTDRDGMITYCAPSVKKISGYNPEQLLGRSLFEFAHPDDFMAANEAYSRELDKEPGLHYTLLRLRHADGQWRWCIVRGHNLLDDPVFKSMVIYFTDDTKRKETEEKLRKSEQHFRSLICNLRQGVMLQDREGKVVVCNQAALQMLGLAEENVLGSLIPVKGWNAIDEEGRSIPGPASLGMQVIAAREPVRDIVMGVLRPGMDERRWILVNAEPITDMDQQMVNVITSFTDITEQKRLAQELIEQEVQKQKLLTQATIAGQEKERQEIGKELHDNINQHLNTTRLYLEVAREKAQGEVLEMINLSHKSLTAIVNEIRHLSQSLVPTTLGDLGLVESVQELTDTLKRGYPFSIEFLHGFFDESRLNENLKLMLFRIIQEQVSNIIRHAGASTIRIKLQSDAEYVILSIADNGVGFNRNNYKKGLGFNNISSRAALFNGKVEIDAAPGYGCALSVVIPLTQPEEPRI